MITGINDLGRSVIAIDGPPSSKIEWEGKDGLYEIWTDKGSTDNHISSGDTGEVPIKLIPPTDGFKVRWFSIAPQDPNVSTAEAAAVVANAFASIQAADLQPDTSRSPTMHTTQTIDAIIVISGRVRLLLDDDECVLGPGDVVMQRGTNHGWVAEGDETALLVAVLVDRAYA